MKYIVSIFLFLEFFFIPNLAYGFDWENDFDKRNQTNNFLFELTDLSAALDACGEYDLSIRALNIANETIEVLFKQDIINTNITLDLKTLVTETNFRLINQYRSKKLSENSCSAAKKNIMQYEMQRKSANDYLNETKEETLDDIVKKYINVRVDYTPLNYGGGVVIDLYISNNYSKEINKLGFNWTFYNLKGDMIDSYNRCLSFNVVGEDPILPNHTKKIGYNNLFRDFYEFIEDNYIDDKDIEQKEIVKIFKKLTKLEIYACDRLD